jgi:DMSO/TMAO reductase YedYZ molybdopterin-dependent catalytic subunit
MKTKAIGRGIFLGVLTSIIVIVLAYQVTVWTGLPFAPFRLFDFMARVMPGAVITFVIDQLVNVITTLQLGPTSEVAKMAEQAIAIAQFVVIGGLFGLVLGFLETKERRSKLPLGGLIGGLILATGFVLVELNLSSVAGITAPPLIWLVALFAVWGLALGALVHQSVRAARVSADPDKLSRREAIYLGGTTLVAVLASLLGLRFVLRARGRDGEETASGEQVPTPPADEELADRIEPAPGTRQEVTSNDEFYRIDINTTPPEVDAENWRLTLDGLVENPLTLTLDDIRARPAVSQYITLTCISNNIGGDLISSSKWTGIRLKDLLEEAGLKPGAQEVAIESVDGFYESVSREDMMDPRTLLVYEMNGEPLPVEHGFPLRIYIPNRYGMKQPKWITSMQVIDEEGPGYWVDRGWSEEAIVHTRAVIDKVTVQQSGDETILSGGIAFSGARGISKVELQLDDGPWNEVELRLPPLSPLMWVQWRYQTALEPGEHTARVRAYDGDGELQVTEESPPHPNGATGIHTATFNL